MKQRARLSITLRLTLLFASASTAVLLLLGYMIANSIEAHFAKTDMEELAGRLKLTQHALEKVRSTTDLAELKQQLSDSLIGQHGLSILVAGADGTAGFATDEEPFPSTLTAVSPTTGMRSASWRTSDGRPMRGISRSLAGAVQGQPISLIAVALDISDHERFLNAFRHTMWQVLILAAILCGFLGWAAAHRGLAPLQAMRREVETISARRLNARLSASSVPVELADLALTMNEMLSGLEMSFDRLSNFSSDLAHELRTPVSNLLTQTQVTLSRPRTANEYGDILASNSEELERLSRMIADMLFLAKSDNELAIPNREPVDLIEEAKGVIDFYEALADEKDVTLTHSGAGSVSGDQLMVRRAISNLLSNAIRHTPRGGRISIYVSDAGGDVRLTVENTGSTITAEHLPKLFDRFYRVDLSRQRQSEGAGLGLAITRSILRAHGGDATARSSQGVTAFVLQFQAPNSAGKPFGLAL